MKIDLVFIIIICLFLVWSWLTSDDNNKPKTVEKMANTDDVKEAIKQVYNADVQAIRNLSDVATKIQTDGLTVPAHANIRGKLNVGSGANAKDFPDWLSMSIDTPGDAHIRLKTKNDDGKNVYLINRDGHFRLHTQGVGDIFGVDHSGSQYVRSTSGNISNFESDDVNPYISLGKTNTWGKQKLYIQNVDAHTENPNFRVGIHGDKVLMDMSKTHGVRWQRKDGQWTHFDWVDGLNYIRGPTQLDGTTIINGTTNINGVTTVNGDMSVKGAIATKVNIIYPVKWDRNYWLDQMTGWFSKSDPDGTKREFILIHPGNFDVNHPNRWIVYMVGIKVGIQVIYFQHQPVHEGIPNPYTNGSNDNSWRRTI